MKNINYEGTLAPATLALMSLSFISLFGVVACNGTSESSKPITNHNPTPIVNAETSNEAVGNDTLIFGSFYGHCQGETCIETFKLADGKLYEDTEDDYQHQSFDFQQLSDDKYKQVKTLLNEVPAELLAHKTGRIGCPDCADGGGVYIAVTDNGKLKSWQIDNNLDNVPSGLHTFVKSVQDKLSLLEDSLSKDKEVPNVCPAYYDPICAKEVVNAKEVFNTYSNSCELNLSKNLVLSTTKGVCKSVE